MKLRWETSLIKVLSARNENRLKGPNEPSINAPVKPSKKKREKWEPQGLTTMLTFRQQSNCWILCKLRKNYCSVVHKMWNKAFAHFDIKILLSQICGQFAQLFWTNVKGVISQHHACSLFLNTTLFSETCLFKRPICAEKNKLFYMCKEKN